MSTQWLAIAYSASNRFVFSCKVAGTWLEVFFNSISLWDVTCPTEAVSRKNDGTENVLHPIASGQHLHQIWRELTGSGAELPYEVQQVTFTSQAKNLHTFTRGSDTSRALRLAKGKGFSLTGIKSGRRTAFYEHGAACTIFKHTFQTSMRRDPMVRHSHTDTDNSKKDYSPRRG
jgi:hypothetical protein